MIYECVHIDVCVNACQHIHMYFRILSNACVLYMCVNIYICVFEYFPLNVCVKVNKCFFEYRYIYVCSHIHMYFRILWRLARTVLQRVAACCSVLQCAAVCCSVLQRVSAYCGISRAHTVVIPTTLPSLTLCVYR